mmetsp:Transcript_475/g.655  ORF Transcript_475/g.655 Transcript_475/m.655 type:complete len:178 (+) Transcript_475:49-582(+)
MMQFMKRDRNNSASNSSPPDKSQQRSLFARKNRSDFGSTGDESSSCAELSDEAWRAGNFLAGGPPQDDDWWSDASSTSSFVEDTKKAREHEEINSSKRAFRNRGLETWRKTREAWNEASANGVSPSPKAKCKTLSRFRRRDLVRNLLAQRQFVLPQRMNLKELIGVYMEVWNGDSSD